MTMNTSFKKWLIGGLTAAMVIGGPASAFADGKGKDHDKGKNHKNIIVRGDVKIYLSFDDVEGGDVEWANKSIANLSSMRVFEGYEDGTFQPRKPITRVEAITAAVRLMGLRDKAESAEEKAAHLNFSDAEKIAKKYPWAVGYVAVAAENDLFQENEKAVQPEKPADRLWATILLVKALKLENEAKAKMNTTLSFNDADDIPAGAVGYVAVAVERGLINGYENNTFRPNKPVTRAELAALLERTGNQLPTANQNVAMGTVTAAVYSNTLTIAKAGVTNQLTLDPNAFIFRDGAKITAADIKVGDVVRARLYNNVVIFIEVVDSAQPNQTNFSVEGKLNFITLNGSGEMDKITVTQSVYSGTAPQPTTYKVSSEVKIFGDPSQLVPNHDVVLQGRDSVVTTIQVK